MVDGGFVKSIAGRRTDEAQLNGRVQTWRRLPDIDLRAQVLALTCGESGVWLGGAGGAARVLPEAATGVSVGLGPVTVLAASAGWVLAGGMTGIARLAENDLDAGWHDTDIRGATAPVAALCLLPTFADDGAALAGTVGDGVLRTDDGGCSWRPVNFGMHARDVTALVAHDSVVVAGTENGIYRSTNDGLAWRHCTSTSGNVIAALAVLPSGAIVAVAEDGGILGSDDGSGWSRIAATAPADALAATNAGTLLLAQLDGGLLRSTDSGLSWTQVSQRYVSCFAIAGRIVYAGSDSEVLMSTDDGNTWRSTPTPPVHDLARLITTGDQVLAIGSWCGIARNSGTGWQVIADPPVPLSCAAIAPSGAIHAGGAGGLACLGPSGWKTVVDEQIRQLVLSSTGVGWAAPACHGDWLLSTQDGGLTWERRPVPFGALPASRLLLCDGLLIAVVVDVRADTVCIWESADDGQTWQQAARAHTAWPIITGLDTPPLLGLDRRLIRRTCGSGWTEWMRFDDEIRCLAGDATGIAVLTNELWWTPLHHESWRALGAQIPAGEVLDIGACDGRLYCLMTGGRIRHIDDLTIHIDSEGRDDSTQLEAGK